MSSVFGRKALAKLRLLCPHARDGLVNAMCDKNASSWRTMMTIQDVRDSLRKVVGASSSFSDGTPNRSNLKDYLVQDQKQLPPRRMKDSLQNVIIPLSDKSIREKYLNSYDTIRFGHLLENLDTFAVLIGYEHNRPMMTELGVLMEDLDLFGGVIAYKHCDPHTLVSGESPLSIVTAMVDEIKIRKHDIDPTKDIFMKGHVTWTGRSSIEITMWLHQNDQPVLDAQFVMVARDAESKTAATVCPLEATSADEEQLIHLGVQHKEQRILEADESLFETAPTPAEQRLVHNLFLKTLDSRSKSFSSRVLPKGSIWMGETKLKNAIVCFPEQRNIHNKVFGGFLMRKAFELAWADACVFSKSRPLCVFMDDIFFHCPVPIGSLLLMSSQISYTQNEYFVARVHAEVMDTTNGVSRTSNVFYFTFTSDTERLPTVTPQTYGEAMLYLDCKRRLQRNLDQ